MNRPNLQKIEVGSLSDKLTVIDNEFKGFLSSLAYKSEHDHEKLKTFSPLDAVADFEQQGIHAVVEPTREEMLADDNAFNKLLANMIHQCQPGTLSDDDLVQISGINGRDVQVGL